MRPLPAGVSDTEPYFLVQPAEEPGQGESTSQLSLGTQPVGSASQETMPGLHESQQSQLSLGSLKVRPLAKRPLAASAGACALLGADWRGNGGRRRGRDFVCALLSG